MLVTLASNVEILANASHTFSYSPESVQKVLVQFEDASGNNAFDGFVTVQIGSRTICNKIKNFGLAGISQLQNGTAQGDTNCMLELDFGSHICGPNENLYVTVHGTSAEIDASDISAIVDEPFAGSVPLMYNSYSDNTFTATNVLSAVGYDSAKQTLEEDDYPVTVKTASYSSAPSIISAVSNYRANQIGGTEYVFWALLQQNAIPMDTSYNWSSSAVMDTIITCEALASTQPQEQKAKAMSRVAIASNKAGIR